MSNVENGDFRPVPEDPDPGPGVVPGICSPRYPSLVCVQCQERCLIQPVLPSAPDPVTPVFERVSYPVLPILQTPSPYYCRPVPTDIQDDGEVVTLNYRNSANTSALYDIDVAPAIQEATPDQTTTVPPGTEGKKTEWTRKYCSRSCWMVGVFLVLVVVAAFTFHQFYRLYYRIHRGEEGDRIYHHDYFN